MIVYERNSISVYDHSAIWRVLFCSWHPISIYGGRVWYVLNVVQRGSKLIPVYQICTPPDRSDCGCEAENRSIGFNGPILISLMPRCCYPVGKEVVLNQAVIAVLEIVGQVWLPNLVFTMLS